ncbi:MAG: hypothetical protein ABR598_06365 [Candidatus Dormibacteria bacterium]
MKRMLGILAAMSVAAGMLTVAPVASSASTCDQALGTFAPPPSGNGGYFSPVANQPAVVSAKLQTTGTNTCAVYTLHLTFSNGDSTSIQTAEASGSTSVDWTYQTPYWPSGHDQKNNPFPSYVCLYAVMTVDGVQVDQYPLTTDTKSSCPGAKFTYPSVPGGYSW